MNSENYFFDLDVKFFHFKNSSIAYRVMGCGPKVLFIHGFPLFGYTWRKILPDLSKLYECYIVDLPGLGYSKWTANTSFDIEQHAKKLLRFCNSLNLKKLKVIAHDSGASIARIMAIKQPDYITHLVLINTEMPDHRPPWIPFYQRVSKYKVMIPLFRLLIQSRIFRQSRMGFKAFYSDISMFKKKENMMPYILPFITSKEKTKGALNYLKGINWRVIDDFKRTHSKIKSKILFIWGENDVTFPLNLLDSKIYQFETQVRIFVIKDASLLPHEEKSEEFNTILIPFFNNN